MPSTVQHALRDGSIRLSEAKIAAAPLEAEVLLAHVMKCDRVSFRARPEAELKDDALARYFELVRQRESGVPIAYLVGEREFWSMTFAVTPATLIPRAETERLVELALECLPADAACRVADLGTGSGAIAIALARERPKCQFVATDISDDALIVASQNAARHAAGNIDFRRGAWFEAVANERFDLVVSNPPYIASADPHLSQGDLRFEPSLALSCGDDSLRDLRQIIATAPGFLKPNAFLIVEHGFDQSESVQGIFYDSRFRDIEAFNDYAGVPRVVRGRNG